MTIGGAKGAGCALDFVLRSPLKSRRFIIRSAWLVMADTDIWVNKGGREVSTSADKHRNTKTLASSLGGQGPAVTASRTASKVSKKRLTTSSSLEMGYCPKDRHVPWARPGATEVGCEKRWRKNPGVEGRDVAATERWLSDEFLQACVPLRIAKNHTVLPCYSDISNKSSCQNRHALCVELIPTRLGTTTRVPADIWQRIVPSAFFPYQHMARFYFFVLDISFKTPLQKYILTVKKRRHQKCGRLLNAGLQASNPGRQPFCGGLIAINTASSLRIPTNYWASRNSPPRPPTVILLWNRLCSRINPNTSTTRFRKFLGSFSDEELFANVPLRPL
ncbi:unnamed protein product [Caenorhabditis auriculariae]|uniref:Uncharacterized protein n=1 Tax=Caenorhabditis auriculariae TaxID=2777116 RepID=A0A8S1HN99_9PELO|nr:unnamed protein product [Caenorhabditis auriculariae]